VVPRWPPLRSEPSIARGINKSTDLCAGKCGRNSETGSSMSVDPNSVVIFPRPRPSYVSALTTATTGTRRRWRLLCGDSHVPVGYFDEELHRYKRVAEIDRRPDAAAVDAVRTEQFTARQYGERFLLLLLLLLLLMLEEAVCCSALLGSLPSLSRP